MSSIGSFRYQFRASEEDVAAVTAALKRLPEGIRRKVARKGIREWAKRLRTAVRAMAYPKAKRTRRNLAVKVKTYKRAIVWGAVGVKSSGERRSDPSWRSHLFDGGWRPWPKGTRSSQSRTAEANAPRRAGNWKPNYGAKLPAGAATNRGWRKGLRRRYGNRIFRLQYLTQPARSHIQFARTSVVNAVGEALKEAGRG